MKYSIVVRCNAIRGDIEIPLFENRTEWETINPDTVLPEKGIYEDWRLLKNQSGPWVKNFSISINGQDLLCSGGALYEKNIVVTQPLTLQYGLISFSLHLPIDNKTVEYRSQLYQCTCKKDDDSINLQRIITQLVNLPESLVDLLRFPNYTTRATNDIGKNRYSMLNGTFIGNHLGNSQRSIPNIYSTYKRHEAFFLNQANYILKRESVIVPIHRAKSITRDGIIWSIRNSSMIPRPNSDNQGWYMIPSHTLSAISIHNRNTYENKSIVSFLDTVLQSVKHETAAIKIGHDYHIPDMILFQDSLTSVDMGHIDVANLENLRRNYRNLMGIDEKNYSPVRTLPGQTKVFQEIPVYRDFYNLFINWFCGNRFCHEHGGSRLKTHLADTLYENYCWVAILKMFLDNGFSKHGLSKRNDYDKPDYEIPCFANVVSLRKNSVYVKLFYQPYIRTSHILCRSKNVDAGFMLYKRVSNSNRKEHIYLDGWSPDFMIKVESELGIRYGILDAKFRNMKDLFAEFNGEISTMEECLSKYYLNIMDDHGGSPISLLWLLQGRAETDTCEIKREGEECIGSYFPASLFENISYGALSLNIFNEEKNLGILWDKVEKFLIMERA